MLLLLPPLLLLLSLPPLLLLLITAAAAASPVGSDVKISLKGPQYSKHHTVWHSALYNTADAQAEFDGFVNNKARWVPFLNGRHIGGPGCPADLDPKGAPGPVNNRCWHWTPVT